MRRDPHTEPHPHTATEVALGTRCAASSSPCARDAFPRLVFKTPHETLNQTWFSQSSSRTRLPDINRTCQEAEMGHAAKHARKLGMFLCRTMLSATSAFVATPARALTPSATRRGLLRGPKDCESHTTGRRVVLVFFPQQKSPWGSALAADKIGDLTKLEILV